MRPELDSRRMLPADSSCCLLSFCHSSSASRFSAGAAGQVRDQRCDVLQVAVTLRRDGVSDARKLKALEDENRRLKKLLDLRELVQMYVEARGASPRTCGR